MIIKHGDLQPIEILPSKKEAEEKLNQLKQQTTPEQKNSNNPSFLEKEENNVD